MEKFIADIIQTYQTVRDAGVAVQFRPCAGGFEWWEYTARFEPCGVFLHTQDWRVARLAITYGGEQPTPEGWFVYFPAERGDGGPTLL